MRNKYVIVFAVCLIGVIALAWYHRLPRPHGPTTYSAEYVLTKNGNHTQIQSTYSNGVVTTQQIMWLKLDDSTAAYHYFRCTPPLPRCTVAGCPFSALTDTR